MEIKEVSEMLCLHKEQTSMKTEQKEEKQNRSWEVERTEARRANQESRDRFRFPRRPAGGSRSADRCLTLRFVWYSFD